MKVLGRGARIAKTQIIRSAKLQKPFESRARMLRSMPFVALVQEHRESRRLFPFIFAGRNVLIDDRLCDVIEIAELRFPCHQRILSNYGIAILKTQHAGFGKGTVENFKASM